MADDDALFDIARMGIDAEAFVRTPLGKFMMDKAKREEADAIQDLIEADPEDGKVNREIRNRIHVVRMFLTWMSDAIEVGYSAQDQLRDQENFAAE